VTKGDEIGSALVNAVLASRQQPPEWVAALQQACPSFFGQSQLLTYRANDALQHAGRDKLEEAMEHYRRAARAPGFDLHEVCGRLWAVQHFTGAVDLALLRVELLDRNEITFQGDEVRGTDATVGLLLYCCSACCRLLLSFLF
jgi:hypothetical protein